MNDKKQSLLYKIKQTYLVTKETQKNNQNIIDLHNKLKDIDSEINFFQRVMRSNKLELANAKNKSGKFKALSVPKIEKNQPLLSDETTNNTRIKLEQYKQKLEEKQNELHKLKKPDYKPIRKWKWWEYAVLVFIPLGLWAYVLSKIIQNKIIALSVMKNPSKKDVALFNFLASGNAEDIGCIVGLIIIIAIIIIFRKMIPKREYNQKMVEYNQKRINYKRNISEYKEKIATYEEKVAAYKEKVAAQKKLEAQLARRNERIKENKRRRVGAENAVKEIPAIINKNKIKIRNYEYLRDQCTYYLKQAQQFRKLLKSKEDLFIDVPSKRFGNLNYYAELYELVYTEQALTAGDAVRLAEDRWERAEQNLALRQDIERNSILMRNTIEKDFRNISDKLEKGFCNVSDKLEVIIEQHEVINKGIEDINHKVTLLDKDINVIDADIKNSADNITSSIDTNAKRINRTIQSGIAANVAVNASIASKVDEANRQLGDTNRKLNDVNEEINVANRQFSRKLPRK